MDFTTAICTIEGTAPYSQSRQHEEPMLEREQHDAYDKRTWRSKMTTATIGGKKHMVIPSHGMHQAIAAAAKYSKRKIPGQGTATWTQKFTSGIGIPDLIPIDVDLEKDVRCVTISCNADGIRGSGKRVPRRFPEIDAGWQATFNVYVFDPIITEPIFREMLEVAGLLIGVGRFRPEKGGSNGRFVLTKIKWNDARVKVAA